MEVVNSFCLFCNPLDGQWSLTRSSEWWVFKARYILQLISGPQMAKDPCQGLAPARMLFRDRFFSDTLIFSDTLNISMVKTSVSTQSLLSVWWLLAWTMSCNLSSPSGQKAVPGASKSPAFRCLSHLEEWLWHQYASVMGGYSDAHRCWHRCSWLWIHGWLWLVMDGDSWKPAMTNIFEVHCLRVTGPRRWGRKGVAAFCLCHEESLLDQICWMIWR